MYSVHITSFPNNHNLSFSFHFDPKIIKKIVLLPQWLVLLIIVSSLSFFKKFILFIYLFLAALGLCCCARAFSSCREQGYCSLRCAVFSLRWLLLLAEHGLQVRGLQQLWHTGSVVVACGLQSAGSEVVEHRLSAPRHVGSSRTRARTHVPYFGRRILNHCTTREALPFIFNF